MGSALIANQCLSTVANGNDVKRREIPTIELPFPVWIKPILSF